MLGLYHEQTTVLFPFQRNQRSICRNDISGVTLLSDILVAIAYETIAGAGV
jgi:hypothetical protein